MAKEQHVTVTIMGRNYTLRAEEDPQYVRMLAAYVDDKLQEIAKVSPRMSTTRLAILAAINIANIGDSVTPEEAGLTSRPIEELRGGDAAFNAAALRRLLLGEEGAYRDAVLLNSAGALIVAGEAADWRDGVEEAAEILDRGLAKALLDCWIDFVK